MKTTEQQPEQLRQSYYYCAIFVDIFLSLLFRKISWQLCGKMTIPFLIPSAKLWLLNSSHLVIGHSPTRKNVDDENQTEQSMDLDCSISKIFPGLKM